MSRRRRTTPAADVLKRLRREAPPINPYPPPQDPWMWTAHTMQVPIIVYVPDRREP